MSIEIRQARPTDAKALSDLLNVIIEAGGTTGHRNPFDAERMLHHYIQPERGIGCTVAEDGDLVLGFQSTVWTSPGDAPIPANWAIIASFVSAKAQGRGVGRLMFQTTMARAKASGVIAIDATIRKENTGGIAYYGRMGFSDYRSSQNTISKKLTLVADD